MSVATVHMDMVTGSCRHRNRLLSLLVQQSSSRCCGSRFCRVVFGSNVGVSDRGACLSDSKAASEFDLGMLTFRGLVDVNLPMVTACLPSSSPASRHRRCGSAQVFPICLYRCSFLTSILQPWPICPRMSWLSSRRLPRSCARQARASWPPTSQPDHGSVLVMQRRRRSRM